MAEGEDSLSPAPNENEVFNCKYCLKKVVTKVKCIKCAGVFHPACFKQSSELRNAECKHETKSSMTTTSSAEKAYLNEENKLLRQMIADKNVIIDDKEKLIQLLQEKILILEAKQLNTPSNNNLYPGKNEIDKQTKSMSSKKSHTAKNSQQTSTITSNTTNPTTGNSKLQGEPIVTVNQVAAEILKIKTQQTANEIINLTKEDYDDHKQHLTETSNKHNEEQIDSGFTQVRRRNKRTHKVGTGEGDEHFKGKEVDNRKIWLFVSKVPDKIGIENIKKYIQNRTNLDDVYVKKLTTRQSRTDHQSFMIGLNPEVQEQVYEPSFWPKNIYFNRFNFKKGQHFLDHSLDSQRQANFQTPASFQNSINP